MRYLNFSLILAVVSITSCRLATVGENPRPANSNTAQSQENTLRATAKSEANPEIGIGRATPDKSAATAECQKIDPGEYEVVRNQTFAIDFEPFRGSCFVTSHNPEYADPPLESEFAIYKNGKRVFQFENQFNGVTFGCWVDAVSFQDLNDDNRTDIIVVSKCSAKSDTYNENMLYVNTGKGFETNIDVNYRLSDFKRVKDVADFIKENGQMFFK